MTRLCIVAIALLLAPASAALAQSPPPVVKASVSHYWPKDVCSKISVTPDGIICEHGPAWGSAIYGCPKGYTPTLELGNKLDCTLDAAQPRCLKWVKVSAIESDCVKTAKKP